MSKASIRKQFAATEAAERAIAQLVSTLEGSSVHEEMEPIQHSLQRQLTSLAHAARSLAHLYDPTSGAAAGNPGLADLERAAAESLDTAAKQCDNAAASLDAAAETERLIARVSLDS